MITIYVSILLIVAVLCIFFRRLNGQSDQLGMLDARQTTFLSSHSSDDDLLDRITTGEDAARAAFTATDDNFTQLSSVTRRMGDFLARFSREINDTLATHEERLDTLTKRVNDGWSQILRIQGRLEATPSHFESAADDGSELDPYDAADFTELRSRVTALEQTVRDLSAAAHRRMGRGR